MSVYDKLDLDRYSRQIPMLRISGQLRLLDSTVAVIGLGGLGSTIAYHLTAAGVGKLILVDGELVEASNLNRQILYETEDIGLPKAILAAKRLKGLNPNVELKPIPEPISRDNIGEILSGVDLVIDALDDWRARLIIDEYVEEADIPMVHGAVDGFFGQATTIIPGKTPCLACIAPGRIDNRGCRAALAPVVSIIASLESLEAVKILAGLNPSMVNKLLVVDAASLSVDSISLAPVDCSKCRRKFAGLL